MMEIRLRTLTPLWTGGVDQTCDRLHETGLIGSLRWWYEALVRGLGGYACDPTSEKTKERCQFDSKAYEAARRDGKSEEDAIQAGLRTVCTVCSLFGCTGWARKFRLDVISKPKIKNRAIAADQNITIAFIPLRNIADEEWCLLEATLRLISEYGAMGGKTIFKPSDEPNRQNEFHHQDFGLVEIHPTRESRRCSKTLEEIKVYLLSRRQSGSHKHSDKDGKKHDDYSWASLVNFWCVKGRYLARQDAQNSPYNQVVGRKQPKSQATYLQNNSDDSRWLAGSQQESKKVFSFKHPTENGRTFGFVKPGTIDYEGIKDRLQAVWEDFNPDKEFITGEQIIQKLFSTQPSEPAGGAP